MAGRIPRDFIDDLLDRTDIVGLIDARVRLKKAGKNYQACCPFHNEKSPSFTVSAEKQFYHCFGCGAHGNAISFIMEYDKLEFPDAVEELASFNGLEVPREQGAGNNNSGRDRQQKEADFQLMEDAARYFQYQLRQHPQKQQAVDYLKQRGLSGEVCQKWGIGFAPAEWDGLLKTLGRDQKQIKQLLELKLITSNDKGRKYDFFRERIMFPIRDRRGRVVGFGGRVLGEGSPKYLNSPETRLFHKGRELYGFYQSKQATSKLKQVLVVEGYMDVVALSQYQIDYAVAALGTSTTPEHIQMLFRNTEEVICCYDGDRAGRDAAWRAMENALPYLTDNSSLKFLFLPDGEDPDTYVRQHGKDALEQQINTAIPLSQFIFERLKQHHQLVTDEGKAAFRAEFLPLVEQISTADNLKDILLSKLDKELGTSTYAAQQLTTTQYKQANESHIRPEKAKLTPIRVAMALLLEQPELAMEAQQAHLNLLRTLPTPGVNELVELFEYCQATRPKNTAQIIEHWRGQPMANWLSKLSMLEHFVEDDLKQDVFNDTLGKLFDQYLEYRFELLMSKQRSGHALTQSEKEELQQLLMESKVSPTENDL